MIYEVYCLPHVIPVGIQSETGVSEIGFNVKPWLDAWDGLELSVWATRPGEAAAYPVADTEMVGNVLYWYPNDADTAIAGEGKVEIVGITGDKRKLSGTCATSIKATSLGTTQEPPEGIKPYYEDIIRAAEDVKASVDVGAGGLYLVRSQLKENSMYVQRSDRTQEEIREKVSEGKTCILVDKDGRVYSYFGEVRHSSEEGDCPTFIAPAEYKTGVGIVYWRAQVLKDGTVSTSGYNPARTPNPYKLTLTGAVDAKYDGSESVSVEIPETPDKVFVVTVTNGDTPGNRVSDRTPLEILSEVQNGKACFVNFPGEHKTMPLTGFRNNSAVFELFTLNQINGWWYESVTINADKTAISGSRNVYTNPPPPQPPVSDRNAVQYQRWDGAMWGPATIDQLKADIGSVEPTKTVILPETELTVIPDMGVACITAEPLTLPSEGAMCTVTYNGADYRCPTIYCTDDAGVAGYVLGNYAAIGMPGGNADAPFVIVLMPVPQNMGDVMSYGMVMPMDGSTGITVSIVQEGNANNDSGNGSIFIVNVPATVYNTSTGHDFGAFDKTFAEFAAAQKTGKYVRISVNWNNGPSTYGHVIGFGSMGTNAAAFVSMPISAMNMHNSVVYLLTPGDNGEIVTQFIGTNV